MRVRADKTQLAWLDRAGRELGVIGPPADHYAPRLSPDGTRLAEDRLDPDNSTNGDIWLMDLARSIASRFTFDPADDTLPVWSPDGTRLFFASSREGVQQLYQALSDRPGSEEPLLRSGAWKAAGRRFSGWTISDLRDDRPEDADRPLASASLGRSEA